ncbi:FKBP12-associated protein [Ascosphaera atra]|nr:FKBP12-associated protein [Ascosphaera atra]
MARPRNRPRRGRNDQAPVAASGEVTANGQSQSQSQPQSQEQRQQQLSRRPKRQQPRPQQPAEPQSQSQSQSQPNGQPQPQQSDASQNGDGRRRQRNPRGKKNNAPGKPTPQNSPRLTAGPGRVFGAGLTRPQNEQAQPELRASAPEFVPGQAVPAPVATEANNTATVEGSATGKSRGPRSRGAKKPKDKVPAAPKPPAPVFDKSTADDITTRIHEDIAHALYECPVCTSEIGRKTKVWSCTHCWTVFHLTCIKKWSSNEGAAVARPRGEPQSADDLPEKRQWRCPGCNLPHETLPRAYTCWCEKESDPRPLPGLPPHSCGQTCSKPRAGCPHPCDSVCHAGPCPPCTAMGPKQTCFCGRHESQRKCLDTDYVNGWSCGEVCGEYLPCMEHMCQRRCHEGLCGACEETVEARCYCGKAATQMLCSAQGEEAESRRYLDDDVQDEEEVDEWTGTFACKDVCGRMFDCGKHLCQKPCHPQDAEIPHCPKSPDMVTHCPCGKTRLSDIDGFTPRTSCEDPSP